MKAYSLLVDNPDSSSGSQDCPHDVSTSCEKNKAASGGSSSNVVANVKEKGFVPSLYAGIKRCPKYNHLHVDRHTDYIMGLIIAAEPELLGKYVDYFF